MSGIIALLLISTISSMMIAGPRVICRLFASVPLMRFVSGTDRSGNPVRAIMFQAVVAITLLHAARFESLLYYTAFTLSLFTALTVSGVIVLRRKLGAPSTYRAFAYPLSPLIFVAANAGIGGFFIVQHPYESLAGLSTALAGYAVYRVSDRRTGQPR
jgi:APA family basic amino acid/polyamine antiporter